MSGKNHSIYFTSNVERLCTDMLTSKRSLSDLISSSVRSYAAMDRMNLRISEGAYVCLAAGRLDLIQCLNLDDGVTVVTMKEEAYRMHGVKGPFADAKDELMKYLDGEE